MPKVSISSPFYKKYKTLLTKTLLKVLIAPETIDVNKLLTKTALWFAASYKSLMVKSIAEYNKQVKQLESGCNNMVNIELYTKLPYEKESTKKAPKPIEIMINGTIFVYCSGVGAFNLKRIRKHLRNWQRFSSKYARWIKTIPLVQLFMDY